MSKLKKITLVLISIIFIFLIITPALAGIAESISTVSKPTGWLGLKGDSDVTLAVPIGELTKTSGTSGLAQYVSAFCKFALGAAATLATAMIAAGGFIWLTAGGSPERVSKAKDFIVSALLGLLLALLSYVILNTINPELVNPAALRIDPVDWAGDNWQPENGPPPANQPLYSGELTKWDQVENEIKSRQNSDLENLDNPGTYAKNIDELKAKIKRDGNAMDKAGYTTHVFLPPPSEMEGRIGSADNSTAVYKDWLADQGIPESDYNAIAVINDVDNGDPRFHVIIIGNDY